MKKMRLPRRPPKFSGGGEYYWADSSQRLRRIASLSLAMTEKNLAMTQFTEYSRHIIN